MLKQGGKVPEGQTSLTNLSLQMSVILALVFSYLARNLSKGKNHIFYINS